MERTRGTRIGFFRHLTYASLALLLVGCWLTVMRAEQTPGPSSTRPNIVFAFADDWGRYASAYARLEPGGPSDLIQTPHFDRIAEEGVLFTQAYVNAPSCTPCRSSLLSGQHFWRTGRGAILQGAMWDPSIPSYPLILKEHGYHIGHTYKVWSPGTPRNAPYGGAEHAYIDRGTRFNSFSQQVARSKNPEETKAQLFEEVRGNFRDFLADRKEGQPFCYWFGPTNTHRKWIQGSGLQLWGLEPEKLQGKLPKFLPDVAVIREDFADYLGEATAFDVAVGVLLEELERINELDNTLVAVSGDHGIPGIPRGKVNLYDLGVAVALAIRWPAAVPGGRVVEDFVNLPDLAPTFLEAAGIQPPRVMTGKGLLSILKSSQSGLVDPSRTHVVVGRERHVAAARRGNLPYPQRAIRTKDFLYIRNFKPDRWPMGIAPGFGLPDSEFPSFEALEKNTFVAFADLDASPTKAWLLTHRTDPGMERYLEYGFGRRPEEELYDLRQDPFQLNNVAGDPSYRKIRTQLADQMMAVLRETKDPRVLGDGATYDQPPFSDPRRER